jgi:hypothetical protein
MEELLLQSEHLSDPALQGGATIMLPSGKGLPLDTISKSTGSKDGSDPGSIPAFFNSLNASALEAR